MTFDLRSWILFVWALLILGFCRGEGTAQLMPSVASSGCQAYVQGNDGSGKEGPGYGRPETDLLHIRIMDPDEETIYLGFTRRLPGSKPVYYQVLDPDGNVVCSGRVAESSSDPGYIDDDGVEAYVGPKDIGGSQGYEAIECEPAMAGDYLLQFNVNDSLAPTPSETKYYLHPFDVTVADISGPGNPVAISGRLYTYRWHLNTNGGSRKACMDFYTWTPDSLVMRMDMNEIEPYGFTVSFNSTGATQTGNIVADRQSTNSTSNTIPEYPVFLNEPDPEAFPSGTPGEVVYIEVNACTRNGSYCILVNATKPGEMNVYIDLDGDGNFSASDTSRDVYFPYRNTEVGELCIPWDGIDGQGENISSDQKGVVKVEFLAGIVHFPIWDAENHPNGFSCDLIRPPGFSPKMYFDNSEIGIGTVNLDGCTVNCNSWTSNQGDQVLVNTWLNTITSADQDSFIIGTFCPPLPENDSFCTLPGQGIQAPILANDWDPDNELDSASVVLDTLRSGAGSISFSPSNDLLTFFPDEYDSTQVRFWYWVSDQTAPEDGGPLSDSAEVIIDITSTCTASAILPIDPIYLTLERRRKGPFLKWRPELVEENPVYLIEKSLDGHTFSSFRETKETYYLDPCSKGEVRSSTDDFQYYRVRMKALGGGRASSNVVQLRVEEPARIDFSLYREGSGVLRMRYRSPEPARVEVHDLRGAMIYRANLPEAHHEKSLPLHLSDIYRGVFLVYIYTHDRQEARRIYLR